MIATGGVSFSRSNNDSSFCKCFIMRKLPAKTTGLVLDFSGAKIRFRRVPCYKFAATNGYRLKRKSGLNGKLHFNTGTDRCTQFLVSPNKGVSIRSFMRTLLLNLYKL